MIDLGAYAGEYVHSSPPQITAGRPDAYHYGRADAKERIWYTPTDNEYNRTRDLLLTTASRAIDLQLRRRSHT
jgi:hypothetical protein